MHEPGFGLTLLIKDNAQLALVQSDLVAPHHGFAEGYLEVSALEPVFARCEQHGVTITQLPTSHPWNMRDFVVLDPDGYAIAVGARIKPN
jgi:catechol 2,3-dioxygenase-like lactoylglutathione lyase family enzyme